jgi:hypothetical protein
MTHRSRRNDHLERLVNEPGRPLHTLLTLAHRALALLTHIWPALAVLFLGVALATAVIARARRRALARGGRVVTIGVPPDVDPAGGQLLWSALHDLLRPHLARLFARQYHLA